MPDGSLSLAALWSPSVRACRDRERQRSSELLSVIRMGSGGTSAPGSMHMLKNARFPSLPVVFQFMSSYCLPAVRHRKSVSVTLTASASCVIAFCPYSLTPQYPLPLSPPLLHTLYSLLPLPLLPCPITFHMSEWASFSPLL